ncbi:GMC oxidoreductase [Streptomyces sp. ISL-43]|uniref:GMC oxidoreductase n=1 Tax=Streptomyces sp. ISL-43 TaxID=2819183 RepID=UPI0035A8A4EB
MAVVNPRLRVRGVDGLLVADASVMPAIVTANATVLAIAERAAAWIRDGRTERVGVRGGAGVATLGGW